MNPILNREAGLKPNELRERVTEVVRKPTTALRTLALYLCAWNCRVGQGQNKSDRDLTLPTLDTLDCSCGAAERNKLIVETRKAAGTLSYHNAAEGPCREREADARAKAKAEFDRLARLCHVLEIDWRQGEGYLI